MLRFFAGLASAVLPPSCAACGALGREPFCVLCSDALEPAPPFAIEGADVSVAVWLYGGPVASAIHHLKYHARPELGRSLGLALRAPIDALGAVDAIVPVPLSRRRLVERGYNQARELVRPLRRPTLARALRRDDHAREQVGLDRAARLENLARAFTPGSDDVRGLSVLLVDDVVTTGATAAAATAALRAAGASRVAVLALARADSAPASA